jgi:hypothetical protein
MKTTYTVLWGSFQGHPEGETFEAELDADLEQRAKARGQIKTANKKKKEEKADG